MNRTSTILLGTGMLIASLAAPLAASARTSDNLSYTIGVAVGRVLSDRHAVEVHRRHHGDRLRVSRHRWQERHRALHRHWQLEHRRFHHGGGYRFDGHDGHHYRNPGRHQDRHGRRDHDRDHDRNRHG